SGGLADRAGSDVRLVEIRERNFVGRSLCNAYGCRPQGVRIGTPIHFNARREGSQRICFDPDAADAKLFCFNQGRACTAKRVEHRRSTQRTKSLKIVANEVWRKAQYEPVPAVNGAVFLGETIVQRTADSPTSFVYLFNRHNHS